VQIPRIVRCNRAEKLNRGECPGIGQALPQIGEPEVLPDVSAMNDEPGKVGLHINNDPGGKAHEKAQREPREMRSPKLSLVIPEPKPQHGHETEPEGVAKPEPDPGGEAK